MGQKKSCRRRKKRLFEILPFWNCFQLTLHRWGWSKVSRAKSASEGTFQPNLIYLFENWQHRIMTFGGCDWAAMSFRCGDHDFLFFFLLLVPNHVFSKTSKWLSTCLPTYVTRDLILFPLLMLDSRSSKYFLYLYETRQRQTQSILWLGKMH